MKVLVLILLSYSDPGCSRLADSSQILEEEAGELASPPAQIERVEETKHEDVVNADMNKKKTGSSETIDVEAESSKPEECISNKDEHNIKSPTPLPADEKSSVPRSPLSTAPSAVDTSELKLGTKPEANAAILSELKPRARRERRRSSENPLENIYKKVLFTCVHTVYTFYLYMRSIYTADLSLLFL